MGDCKAAVMIIHVGGVGLNCQSMDAIIFMDPPTSDMHKRQVKGIRSAVHLLMLRANRTLRPRRSVSVMDNYSLQNRRL